MSFVQSYGRAFGLTDQSQVRVLRAPERDEIGLDHVRLQQLHRGVPVRGGELVVHLNGARVMAANGRLGADLPDDVTPAIAPAAALVEARGLVEKYFPGQGAAARYSEPRLEILDRGLLSDPRDYQARLAWFVEATGLALRQFLWIDAQSGVMLLNFSQLADAKSRKIYTASNGSTLPGTLVRSEGGSATGDADQDNAYDLSGLTYDYYLSNHGRDSFDNLGGTIISTAHYCPSGGPCPYGNAFWNGTQMVYGNGYASADDVVGHELTHAVTEKTADLFYYVQSGALNESFSDIFGETIDLTDGVGNDAASVRWKMGEDLSIGAVRDMMTPTLYSDPGKMSDSAYFYCNASAYTDTYGDDGGVHINSGIPNHAYALMVDGGTYNGRTVTGIGLTKAAKIEYRALTTYLTSGSGFIDDYNSLNQSCTDLIGTAGITSSDCTQVTTALQAVEMNAAWACSGATPAPVMCPTGTAVNTMLDTFETSLGNWTATNAAGTWGRTTGFAKGGTVSAWGTDPGSTSDHRLTMTSAVTIPSGGRLYFDHAFEFENSGSSSYDAGVLEYSTNGGTSWSDAGGLVDGGQAYNGFVSSGFGNVLGGRSAFVKSSSGYTGTRLDLSSLTGQSVKFRFRVGSDVLFSSLGWLVDNVTIYRCALVAVTAVSPSSGSTAGGTTVTITGINFVVGSTAVSIGGSAATGVTVTSTSSLTAVTPAHTAGSFTVAVTTAIATGSLASSFSYFVSLFTDDPLQAGITRVKAVHITELQTYVNTLRSRYGLLPFAWTDSTLSAGTTPVKAVHVNELRTALSAAYVAAGLAAPTFTGAITAGSSAITAAQITEIRNAILAIY